MGTQCHQNRHPISRIVALVGPQRPELEEPREDGAHGGTRRNGPEPPKQLPALGAAHGAAHIRCGRLNIACKLCQTKLRDDLLTTALRRPDARSRTSRAASIDSNAALGSAATGTAPAARATRRSDRVASQSLPRAARRARAASASAEACGTGFDRYLAYARRAPGTLVCGGDNEVATKQRRAVLEPG